MLDSLAEVRDYDSLHQALRDRAEQLNASRRTLDGVAGLADGLCEKLLGPGQVRRLGPKSFGAMLSALGVKLVLVEDPEQMARLSHRLPARNNAHVRHKRPAA